MRFSGEFVNKSRYSLRQYSVRVVIAYKVAGREDVNLIFLSFLAETACSGNERIWTPLAIRGPLSINTDAEAGPKVGVTHPASSERMTRKRLFWGEGSNRENEGRAPQLEEK